ncbi:MAG TPA: ABC transporter substrate-binding protein [Stellaceae bacterium]|jgi:peptide/nickel transport system substrate-binding protein|nr:ABC transporter substrate-binding protein [Stellaceae bacterium]
MKLSLLPQRIGHLTSFAAALLLLAIGATNTALAQKSGGILRVYHRDSPASMSIHEEATWSTIAPMSAVFNNLVIYDQHIKQNSLATIRPELAESWSWSEDGKDLTFKLRHGVKWHDGKPFTAADVKCTWDLLTGKGPEKLRLNPRATWYLNLDSVTTNGDDEAVFHMKRPQPAFIALLASGDSPVYPCHVPAHEMRLHPIGTGPFKFVEYKPNETLKLARNPDYWKPGLPYLDGIEYTIIPNRSTALLGFVAGKFDMTFPYEITIPLLKDIKSQAPNVICDTEPLNVAVTLAIVRKPPFDNLDVRRAVAMALDRQAFINILGEGQGDISGIMQPPPEGLWGIPLDQLRPLPGYGTDVEKSRSEAREIMKKLGYGPDNPLKTKVSTRNIAGYRDPATILIDQLKSVYIDAELDTVETANWTPKLTRKDYTLAISLSGSAVDDPDQIFYESYVCKSPRNYTGYCNPEVEALIDQQSMQADPEKRKAIVWDIERRIAADVARPVIFHARAATCWQPYVKNITQMSNSVYNSWRLEDAWLDK